jgi:hypothetical protein
MIGTISPMFKEIKYWNLVLHIPPDKDHCKSTAGFIENQRRSLLHLVN